MTTATTTGNVPPAPLLELRGVRKAYRSPEGESVPVVDVEELMLQPGEQVALKGESGTGKTTLLHLIAGILTPDSGTIRLDGADVTTLPESARDRLRAGKIGYIFQTFNLLHGFTALENVTLATMLAGKPDEPRATALLERVGLAERLHYRPSRLSVGQQQRVAVARALANPPRLVLADEPTGNLDHRHAGEAMDLICGICREQSAALLVVTHDRSMLDRFPRVLELGEINRIAVG